MKDFRHVYQFRIALRGIHPPIWRRIQVPETYSFWDLHVAVQDAMGWEDCHLHEFRMKNPTINEQAWIGIPDEEGWGERDVLPGWEYKIAPYFTMENARALYLYDFGDGWEHTVQLEAILPREKALEYPLCVTGKRTCPPEDVGGVSGYSELVAGDEELEKWYGGKFDPEAFSCAAVIFSNPAERWRVTFQESEE
jgi:hypothetical protein